MLKWQAFWRMAYGRFVVSAALTAYFITVRFLVQEHWHAILINGVVGILQEVAVVLVGFWIGLFVDWNSRRDVMLFANIAVALFGWIPAVFLHSELLYVVILVIDLILAMLGTMEDSAYSAFLKYLMDPTDLPSAEGATATIGSAAFVIGLILSYAGIFVFHFNVVVYFISNSVAAAIMSILLLTLPKDTVPKVADRRPRDMIRKIYGEMVETIQYIREHSFMKYYMLSVAIGNGGSAVLYALIIYFIGKAGGGLGDLWIAGIGVGVGMIGSGVVFTSIIRRVSTLWLTVVADTASAFALAMLAVSPSVVWISVDLAIFYFCMGLSSSAFHTLRVRETPAELQGRLHSFVAQSSSVAEVLLVIVASLLGEWFHSIIVSFVFGALTILVGTGLFTIGKLLDRFSFIDLSVDRAES